MNETAMPRRRVEILDELRGLIVLLMIFYHAIYDLVFVFRAVDPALFQSRFMRWLQLFVACGFIVIAGIMCRYSRNNLRRGAKTFLAGMLVTAVTAAVIPSQLILFGILHFLGICMMLYPLAEPVVRRLHPIAGILACLALFAFTNNIGSGRLGFGSLTLVRLPQSLYELGFLFPLGIHPRFFSSADYYPLLPWIFIFGLGCFLGGYFYNGEAPDFCYRPHCPPLALVGRHALLIYLLHQPVAYGITWAIAKLLV